MLELRDFGYNYQVIYKGAKEDYNEYFIAMSKIDGASKLTDKVGWKVPKCYIPELINSFEVEYVKNSWDDIGKGLKLEPYCYQKETIKFGVDNKKSLLILPCGAGKI